jgi:nucleotide-binding universal stress UspA family protein
MAIKCIVVHMAYDRRHLARLRLSVGLAKKFDAHLNVVYATPNPDFPAGMIGRAASLAFLDDAREEEKAKVEAIKRELADECAGLRSWEWHEEHGGVNDLMARYAHLADLVVVEQEPKEHVEDSIIFHMSDHLVVSAGCPMLLVPWKWDRPVEGKRVLVAWKNTREAIKAVRGGMPFIREAEEVMILASANDKFTDAPGTDLATYLGYHGIEAKVLEPNKKAGKGILKAAEREGCDLIIMGAFSHSRLRELFAGGATDHVMRHTTIPVVMRQ